MSSMFNTLLDQGKSFLNIQKEYKYLVDPHLKLIEETSSPNLKSIIENFSTTYTDKTNKLSAQMSNTDNDGATKQPFIDLINQYNAVLQNPQNIPLSPGLSKTSVDQKLANAVILRNLLIKMNAMVETKLVTATSDGSPGGHVYDYQAGSGQTGVGDQPQLLAARPVLMATNSALAEQQAIYNNYLYDLNHAAGSQIDTEIRAQAAYYKYIVWTIVCITLISYTIKYVSR
jgi:hypothetical protein